jgi:hypothetical protein
LGKQEATEAGRQPVTEIGRNDLSQEDREQLIRLRWLWEKTYAINTDGASWTAQHISSPETVISCASPQELWRAIRADNDARKARNAGCDGYWVETASGPPFKVDTSPRIRHGCSGPPHIT